MSWLVTLDRRAMQWPRFARWVYAGGRWLLIALGVYLALALAYTELQTGRPALGVGIAVACVLATIKGVIMAARRR
jgi:uncharacterized membrane protein YgaE (UPF0421/DUF939 family)